MDDGEEVGRDVLAGRHLAQAFEHALRVGASARRRVRRGEAVDVELPAVAREFQRALGLVHRVFARPGAHQRPTVDEATVGEARLYFEHAAVDGQRVLEAARVVVAPRERERDERRHRVEFDGAVRLGDGLFEAPLREQEEAVPVVRRRVVRVQLDGAAVVLFGPLPVEVAAVDGEAERGVALGEIAGRVRRLCARPRRQPPSCRRRARRRRCRGRCGRRRWPRGRARKKGRVRRRGCTLQSPARSRAP